MPRRSPRIHRAMATLYLIWVVPNLSAQSQPPSVASLLLRSGKSVTTWRVETAFLLSLFSFLSHDHFCLRSHSRAYSSKQSLLTRSHADFPEVSLILAEAGPLIRQMPPLQDEGWSPLQETPMRCRQQRETEESREVGLPPANRQNTNLQNSVSGQMPYRSQ